MNNEIKKLIIVVLTTIFSLAIHAMAPITVDITEDMLSVVASKLTFIGTATLFFLVTYYIIASVFLKYESRLQGSKLNRALIFGGLVGGIWWVGMLEAVFALNSTYINEFILGLLDFLPIVLLCVLVAVFLVKEERHEHRSASVNSSVMIDVGIFTLIITVGRFFRYVSNVGGYSVDSMTPLMLWTIAFALIIGLNFAFLKSAAISVSVIKSALIFTLILFGLHYTMFVIFIPLVFKGMLFDLTMVLLYDLFLVFVASTVCFMAMKKRGKRL
ncbi:hypothetical protein [Desulfuribacillus alkaliarsenatis]|uniref:Uncharacterized protein n=1 Tax=Desulfuribacillus alkaliarsenatis TaxID=766136 RepID=A0A1E5G294_9FIRM|nr:hypothetical protein [Desulfuribacillus alkaliarsenatis]OEF97100.1 hypothetical protein BHF68_05745 [Desulfuribacillus alkaliarsenatis]